MRVPTIARFNLGLNGNAITLSRRLYGELKAVADGDIANPSGSAWSLACVAADRKTRRAETLTLRRSVPFSNHNYQLRFVMAAGGVDPNEGSWYCRR